MTATTCMHHTEGDKRRPQSDMSMEPWCPRTCLNPQFCYSQVLAEYIRIQLSACLCLLILFPQLLHCGLGTASTQSEHPCPQIQVPSSPVPLAEAGPGSLSYFCPFCSSHCSHSSSLLFQSTCLSHWQFSGASGLGCGSPAVQEKE